MPEDNKFHITDGDGSRIWEGNDEDRAGEVLDEFINDGTGWYDLWEEGYDAPILSGGVES